MHVFFFWLSAVFYLHLMHPHFSIRIRHPQVFSPRFTDTPVHSNCVGKEDPGILTSKLLLRIGRMYEASVRLDFHYKNEWNAHYAI